MSTSVYAGTGRFRGREEAGRELGERLARERPTGEIVVLGLARGGMPIAREIARALDAPLDVFLVRKIGAPFNPELAAGAIATGGVVVYNREVLESLRFDEKDLDAVRERERSELVRRERVYRGDGRAPDLKGKTVILADDGIATGATMRAAVEAVRHFEPNAVIAVAPTGSVEAVAKLQEAADKVVVLAVPEPYIAVGAWYEHFPQLSDADVVALLAPGSSADTR